MALPSTLVAPEKSLIIDRIAKEHPRINPVAWSEDEDWDNCHWVDEWDDCHWSDDSCDWDDDWTDWVDGY